MPARPRVVLSWSSGKDCAWALHALQTQPDLEVVGLLTTFNSAMDRVAMHVDPCGERGEFHTFCHTGPMFTLPIPCRTGPTVARDGFVFADVLPAAGQQAVEKQPAARQG